MKSSIDRAMQRYLSLLGEAGIHRFEQLQRQAPASLQQQLARTNARTGFFARLPGEDVLRRLIEKALRGKTGPITLFDLPGSEDYPYWEGGATDTKAAENEPGKRADDELSDGADVLRGGDLPGKEDFPFWDPDDEEEAGAEEEEEEEEEKEEEAEEAGELPGDEDYPFWDEEDDDEEALPF